MAVISKALHVETCSKLEWCKQPWMGLEQSSKIYNNKLPLRRLKGFSEVDIG